MPRARLNELLEHTPLHVTGLGAWSAAGHDAKDLWSSLLAAKSPARWMALPPKIAGGRLPVCEADTPDLDRPPLRRARRMDRSAGFAAAAAWEAWTHAGLHERPVAPERVAVVVGTSRGPMGAVAQSLQELSRGRVLPSLAAGATLASLSGMVASVCGSRGPSLVISAACASSATAITTAAQLLLCGVADVALAGGAEAPLHPAVLAQLHSAGVLSTHAPPRHACRPFDAARSGTVLGEGAAFLVLETAASARRRHARRHARLAGWGLATDPGERAGMRDDASGLANAMRDALALAGFDPARIGYINAHGTGTLLNDLQEARAIRRVFGDTSPRVSSTKPITGHCMGATAALEAVISIQALNHGALPPTLNCDTPDSACPERLVRGAPQPCDLSAVMTNSSGFWGNHASLIFAKP